MKLTVMRNAYMMIALKHTNRPELQGDYMRVFEEFKDYLLGEHVYGLNARDAEGYTVAAPPFKLVLSYEKAVRKEAARKMNQDGTAYPAALKLAWRDATVKERHFTTPLALYAKRPAPAPSGSTELTTKKFKGEQKGGKAKSKGKGKQMAGCASHNAEGKRSATGSTRLGRSAKRRSASLHTSVESASRRRTPCTSAVVAKDSHRIQRELAETSSGSCISSQERRGRIQSHGIYRGWPRCTS